MEFEKLLTQISQGELFDKINGLLSKKKSRIELGLESTNPAAERTGLVVLVRYLSQGTYPF
jgi:hypothetical protein